MRPNSTRLFRGHVSGDSIFDDHDVFGNRADRDSDASTIIAAYGGPGEDPSRSLEMAPRAWIGDTQASMPAHDRALLVSPILGEAPALLNVVPDNFAGLPFFTNDQIANQLTTNYFLFYKLSPSYCKILPLLPQCYQFLYTETI